jgi:hypothetical protein
MDSLCPFLDTQQTERERFVSFSAEVFCANTSSCLAVVTDHDKHPDWLAASLCSRNEHGRDALGLKSATLTGCDSQLGGSRLARQKETHAPP